MGNLKKVLVLGMVLVGMWGGKGVIFLRYKP
jgi:hypothetical protein